MATISEKEVIFLLREYMKKFLLGIVFVLLTVAVLVLLIWFFEPRPEKRELTGLFIRGYASHGHLSKA